MQHVMKSILDRIDRREEMEARKKRKEEREELQKRKRENMDLVSSVACLYVFVIILVEVRLIV